MKNVMDVQKTKVNQNISNLTDTDIFIKNFMKSLNFHDDVLSFYEEGILYYSQNAVLYWLTDDMKKTIEKIESNYNIKVYHVIKGKYEMTGGDILEMIDYLYIPNNFTAEEKNCFIFDFKRNNLVFSYTHNITWGIGKLGDIRIKSLIGGLVRIA